MYYISPLTADVHFLTSVVIITYVGYAMGDSSASNKSKRSRWVAGGLAITALVIVSGSIVANKTFHTDQAAAGPAIPEQAVAVTVAVVEPRQTSLWMSSPAGSRRSIASNCGRGSRAPFNRRASPRANWSRPATSWSRSTRRCTRPRSKSQAQLEAAKARVVFTNGEFERGAAAHRQPRRHPARPRSARQRQSRSDRQRQSGRSHAAHRAAQSRLHRSPRPGRRACRKDRGDGRQSGLRRNIVAGADLARLHQPDLCQLRRGRGCRASRPALGGGAFRQARQARSNSGRDDDGGRLDRQGTYPAHRQSGQRPERHHPGSRGVRQ